MNKKEQASSKGLPILFSCIQKITAVSVYHIYQQYKIESTYIIYNKNFSQPKSLIDK